MTPWLDDLRAAVATNRAVIRRAAVQDGVAFDLMANLAAFARLRTRLAHAHVAQHVAQHVPYRFDGDSHRIVDVLGLVHRGYGACGDAAALVAAAFIEAGRPVKLCYETVEGVPSYAHVRVLVRGEPVEPWPSLRRPATGCTALVDVD